MTSTASSRPATQPRRAADCLQRPLVTRSRFRQQLTPGVRGRGEFTTMTSQAKKHHYVPQALLRHFSIDGAGQRIWVLDKTTGRTFPAPIADVACETHFNTLQIDGRKIVLESAFDAIDSMAAPLLRKILDRRTIGGLSADERYGVALIAATQLLRVKLQRTTPIAVAEDFAEAPALVDLYPFSHVTCES
jgi:hypothetical protein